MCKNSLVSCDDLVSLMIELVTQAGALFSVITLAMAKAPCVSCKKEVKGQIRPYNISGMDNGKIFLYERD